MRRAILAAVLFFSSPGFVSASDPDVVRELNGLFEAEWEYQMREFPTFASRLGDRRYNDQWPDESLEAISRRQEHERELLEQVRGIDAARLDGTDRVNYDLFMRQSELNVERQAFGFHLLPINQRWGIQNIDRLSEWLRFKTVKDYEDWIGRLNGVGDYVDQTIELMREGARRGVIHPKIILKRIPEQIQAQIVEDPEKSPFYKPFKEFSREISARDQKRLRREAKEAVLGGVVPAYRRFAEFFDKGYAPAGLDRVGAWQFPRGKGFYAHAVRKFTATDLTPDEIHKIGKREVKRIRGEMKRAMKKSGFTGSLKDFFEFLRTDPQFYYKNPEDLLSGYRAISKRIDPEVVKLFKRLPRIPYGVLPIPEASAPHTATAYYVRPAADGSRAGYYYVNLYRPETRPKWEMEVLSVHEAVPGHHLQISLAMELGELPKFRRHGGYTAYVEGWGLYSESLGEDLGLYKDPYSKFGQLTYEMWRAVRLVVDTGMHHMKWSRKKALDYFRDNCAKTEHDIANEIDRYITLPGQALAYKIGELKIKELRARAEKRLGEDFDVRDFHDVVLRQGEVPLDLLERSVDSWIESAMKGAVNAVAKIKPPLDPGFIPAVLWNRAYREAARASRNGSDIELRVCRGKSAVSIRREPVLPGAEENRNVNRRFIERMAKFLLWKDGGDRIEVWGHEAPGLREFDRGFFEDLFSGPTAPAAVTGAQTVGCRVGFDLGASDRKCAAVRDGKVVYSEEVRWDPASFSSADEHVEGIADSIRRAAGKLPRVDAVGGACAGIVVGGELRVSSLTRGLRDPGASRGIFAKVAERWRGVPFTVVNDGAAAALAGHSPGRAVLGLALGSSLAAGYADAKGVIGPGIDELAFAPIDYRAGAFVDEWSKDAGCGVQYLSQQAVARLLGRQGEPPAPVLEELQRDVREGSESAKSVYETLGVYLGYALGHYADFYALEDVLLMGRVMSGPGGDAITEHAKRVIAEEFPELGGIRLRAGDERGRRHGQAVAAAGLGLI